MLPLIFVQLAALGIGFGMIISSLTTRYRDLRQFFAFGISLWMYATPIVFPMSQVPQRFKWIVAANPVTVPVEAFRMALYGVGSLETSMIALSVGVTILVVLAGLVLFNQTERTFVDVI